MTTTTNKINLSKETLSILKNFASLNSNILVKPGNVLRTITPSKNGMAEAKVSESFDTEFGIWDLNKFLGVISLFNNPNFEFHDKYVIISGGGSQKVKYYYSEPKLLTTPTKNVNMPDSVVSATLSGTDFTQIQNIKLLAGDYDINFAKNTVAEFSNVNTDLVYWFAMESGSTYTE